MIIGHTTGHITVLCTILSQIKASSYGDSGYESVLQLCVLKRNRSRQGVGRQPEHVSQGHFICASKGWINYNTCCHKECHKGGQWAKWLIISCGVMDGWMDREVDEDE
jgi:hypothetical protein